MLVFGSISMVKMTTVAVFASSHVTFGTPKKVAFGCSNSDSDVPNEFKPPMRS